MRHKALGKHGWSIVPGLLLTVPLAGAAQAAPPVATPASPVQIGIGNPLPNSLVGGTITLSIAYNAGPNKIAAFTVYVDDQIYSSRNFLGMSPRGIHYLELNTQAIPDGHHSIKVVAVGGKGVVLGADVVDLTIRNAGLGAADQVPPLIQFRSLSDEETVSGKISIDLLAEDNMTRDLLVSIFVNRQPKLIKNFPPYTLELNTAEFLNPATGTGSIRLEALAFDKAGNQGKARPVTLNVVPAGSVNQTRKQDDPTSPFVARPAPPRVDADMPEPAPLAGTGTPVLPPKIAGPGGDKPATLVAPGPLMAKATMPMGLPDLAPVGTAPKGGIAATKPASPFRFNPHTARTEVDLPAPLKTGGASPKLAGSRNASPTPLRPASAVTTAKPGAPAAPAAASASGAGVASKGDLKTLPPEVPATSSPAKPSAPVAAGGLVIPLPVPGAQPMPAGPREAAPKLLARNTLPTPEAPGALDAAPVTQPKAAPGGVKSIPVVPPAKAVKPAVIKPTARPSAAKRTAPKPAPLTKKPAAKAPRLMAKASNSMVVVVPAGAKPDARGKVEAQVFTLNNGTGMPKDRSHQLKRGETLEGLARKYGVTSKSILIANGITNARAVRTGSVIKVPGTFDLVLNDKRVAFDVPPRIENGLPLAPFRQIFEHAGGVVVYYPDHQEVRAANDRTEIKLKIGSKEAEVNQVVVVMDRSAFIDNGRTIVPVGFMEKALDLKAEYDVRTGTIILAPK